MKKLLTNKLFMAVFASDMLSSFGDVMYYLALMAYVLQLPDAKLGISIVGLSEALPYLTGFIMGYWADKTVHKVKTIIQTLLFRVGLYVIVGIVIGFQPSLWVVVVVAFINVLSDLAGQYEDGLYTPLSLRIVSNEDRADSFAFRQTARSLFSIGFQTLGAVLVTVFSFRSLAFVNAATFGICACFMVFLAPSLDALVKERPILVDQKKETHVIKDLWRNMVIAAKECIKYPDISKCLVVAPFLNALFTVISLIVAALISQDKSMLVINPVTTLSLLSTFNIAGTILGGFLAMTVFRETRLLFLVKLITLMTPFIFISLLLHFIYGLYCSLVLTTIISGMINPKLNAVIMNTLPEERLAMSGSGIGTYVQFGAVLSRLLVSGLVVLVPLDWISMLFMGLSVLLIAYVYKNRQLAPISSPQDVV